MEIKSFDWFLSIHVPSKPTKNTVVVARAQKIVHVKYQTLSLMRVSHQICDFNT